MSRHHRPAVQTLDPEFSPSTGDPERSAEMPHSKTRLAVGLALWLIWMVCLAALAGLSANPITLNRRQFADADLVIIGSVADVAKGRVNVAETKAGKFSDKQLTIVDLAGIANVSAGTSYIIPLNRRGGRFDVVAIADDKRGRVVYPATDEAESQLAELLKELSRRVAP